MPLVVVSDGAIYEENLAKAGIDYDTLMCMIEAKGITALNEVFVAFYDGNSMFHVYPNPEPRQKFSREAY